MFTGIGIIAYMIILAGFSCTWERQYPSLSQYFTHISCTDEIYDMFNVKKK